jgi:Flp pilus assembly protein TadG
MKLKSNAGSELIEFAFVVVLLFILVFGVIDFSLALYDKAVITNAAREGARAGIVFAPVRPPGSTMQGRLDQTEIRAVVMNYCQGRLVNFGGAALTATDIDVNGEQGVSGDPLTVRVNYTYYHAALSSFLPIGNLPLSSMSVMRSE